MKASGAANSEGSEGKGDQTKKRVNLMAYAGIAVLLLVALWSGLGNHPVNVDIASIASITSWSDATNTPETFPEKLPDLKVSVVGFGFVEKGILYESESLLSERPGAFRIKVENIGSKKSTEWKLIADLPTKKDFSYESSYQSPLLPGEGKIFTLTTDSLAPNSDAKVTFRVDMVGEEIGLLNNATPTRFEIR